MYFLHCSILCPNCECWSFTTLDLRFMIHDLSIVLGTLEYTSLLLELGFSRILTFGKIKLGRGCVGGITNLIWAQRLQIFLVLLGLQLVSTIRCRQGVRKNYNVLDATSMICFVVCHCSCNWVHCYSKHWILRWMHCLDRVGSVYITENGKKLNTSRSLPHILAFLLLKT